MCSIAWYWWWFLLEIRDQNDIESTTDDKDILVLQQCVTEYIHPSMYLYV